MYSDFDSFMQQHLQDTHNFMISHRVSNISNITDIWMRQKSSLFAQFKFIENILKSLDLEPRLSVGADEEIWRGGEVGLDTNLVLATVASSEPWTPTLEYNLHIDNTDQPNSYILFAGCLRSTLAPPLLNGLEFSKRALADFDGVIKITYSTCQGIS